MQDGNQSNQFMSSSSSANFLGLGGTPLQCPLLTQSGHQVRVLQGVLVRIGDGDVMTTTRKLLEFRCHK